MKSIIKRTLLSTLFLGTICITTTALASYNLPYIPRISVTGLAGDSTTILGDGMVPLIGNANSIFYGDIQGKTGRDDAWLASIGAGYRGIGSPTNIFGGYVFLDRDSTTNNSRFWVLNPGLESLGTCWDFRVNGYIPISGRRKYDHSAFGDELGLGQFVTFSGHQQFDRLFNFYEEIGPGADAEVGKIFPRFNRLAIYGGGYFYDLQDASNIKGVEGRIEYPFTNHFTVLVNDTYDNYQHNTIAAGLRISIGGQTEHPKFCDIRQRMVDPVQRNLGALSTGAGIQSKKVRDGGRTILERDNIWFFRPGGVANSNAIGCGTYENPCLGSQFTQSTVDEINSIAPNANFYFSSGPYPLGSRIIINNGQSMYGRTADYKLAAQGPVRPQFTKGLDLQGNNLIDSIQLFNDNSNQLVGINILGNNVTLSNDVIGAQQAVGAYPTAVNIDNAQNAFIINSDINSYSENNITVTPVAIDMDESSLTIINSRIVSQDFINNLVNPVSEAVGVIASNSVLNMLYSNVDVISRVQGFPGNAALHALGMLIANSQAQIIGSQINVSADMRDADANTAFLTPLGLSLLNSNVDMERSRVDVTSIANGINNNAFINSQAVGINLLNSALNTNELTVNTDAIVAGNGDISSRTIGIRGSNNSILNFNNSIINAHAMTNATTLDVTGASATAIGLEFINSNVTFNHSSDIARADFNATQSGGAVNVDAMRINGGTLNLINSVVAANLTAVGNGLDLSNNATGLLLTGNSTANITNSFVGATNQTTGNNSDNLNANTVGLQIEDASTATITNSFIGAYATMAGTAQSLNNRVTGINVQSGILNINNSFVDALGIQHGSGDFVNTSVNGMIVGDGTGPAVANIHHCQIGAAALTNSAVTSNFVATNASALGAGEDGTVNVDTSNIGALASTNIGDATALGIADTNGIINVDNSNIGALASSLTGNALASGIFVLDSASVVNANFNHISAIAIAPQGTATTWGIFNIGGTVNQANNTFFVLPIGMFTAGGNIGP